ncbi:MAG: hypothetical protein GY807_12255 [Gammaproteobacteria bacterium]|nr:hypothetical protein [Gammaproteobacteria bacterium]
MSRRSEKLGWTTSRKLTPSVTFTSSQWSELAKVIGANIPTSAQSELEEILQTYANFEIAAYQAASITAVKEVGQKLANRLDGFLRFGLNGTCAKNPQQPADAESEFDNRLGMALQSRSHGIEVDELATNEPIPTEIADWLDQNDVSIIFTPRLVMEFSRALESAMDHANSSRGTGREVEMLDPFVVGSAFEQMLRETHAWALKHNLPSERTTSDGRAKALPNMLFEALCLLPKNPALRLPNSSEALAGHMKRALSANPRSK